MFLQARVAYSALFFVLVLALVWVARPSLVFDPSGQPRPFGVEAGDTLLPLGVVTVLAAVGSMFMFSLIDMACGA